MSVRLSACMFLLYEYMYFCSTSCSEDVEVAEHGVAFNLGPVCVYMCVCVCVWVYVCMYVISVFCVLGTQPPTYHKFCYWGLHASVLHLENLHSSALRTTTDGSPQLLRILHQLDRPQMGGSFQSRCPGQHIPTHGGDSRSPWTVVCLIDWRLRCVLFLIIWHLHPTHPHPYIIINIIYNIKLFHPIGLVIDRKPHNERVMHPVSHLRASHTILRRLYPVFTHLHGSHRCASLMAQNPSQHDTQGGCRNAIFKRRISAYFICK